MKTLYRRALVLICCSLYPALFTLADPPGPPPPGGDPSLGGTPVGAPIDNGLYILLVLGLGYGFYKYYEMNREAKEKKKVTS